MSDIAVGFSDLVSFYDVRAQEIAAATRYVVAATKGIAAGKGASDIVVGPGGPRTITLELLQAAPPTNSNSVTTPVQTPNADGLRTLGEVTATPAPITVALLTFDVGRNADGYAQVVEITESARQSVHNTAGGYYVDEFGLAPGNLTVDVWVLYGQVPGQQVQNFFDVLKKAKLTQPLSNEIPLRLRFHDTFLERSLVITQDNIRLRTDVEAPNRARLTISATILYDYSAPQGTTQPASALNQGQSAAKQLSTGLLTLGTFFSPSGSTIGATIGAAVSVAESIA
jgi:hypothetical protein